MGLGGFDHVDGPPAPGNPFFGFSGRALFLDGQRIRARAGFGLTVEAVETLYRVVCSCGVVEDDHVSTPSSVREESSPKASAEALMLARFVRWSVIPAFGRAISTGESNFSLGGRHAVPPGGVGGTTIAVPPGGVGGSPQAVLRVGGSPQEE